MAARRGDAETDLPAWDDDGGVDASGSDVESTDVPDSPTDAALDRADDQQDDTGAPIPDTGVEATPDLAVERAPDARADVKPDVTPDLTPDLRPETAPDLAPDLPIDVAPDTRPPTDGAVETPVDTRPVCSADAGQHLCGQTCVDNSVAACGALCVPCPVPANGGATCNGTTCGIACNPNFIPSGSTCIRSCTPTCDAGAVTVSAFGNRFTGVTAGPSGNAGSCGGGAAPDAVFRVVLNAPSDLFVTTHGTLFNTVIYLRSGCCGSELACNDDADGRHTSVLSATNLPAGTYEVFVDGATATDFGSFSVDIFVSPTSSSAGDSCGRPTRIANAALAGTSCGFRDDTSPQPNCSTADGNLDAVYYFVLDEPTTVRFDTCNDTCLDTVLYVRDVCSVPSSQQVCDDDACNGCEGSPNSTQSRASATLGAGAHYVVVDTLLRNPCGTFTLTPQNVPP